MRLWTQGIRIDYQIEEFKNVHQETIEYQKITPGLQRLLKHDLTNTEIRQKDYERRIDDSPNLSRPPVSEDLLTLLFSNDLPLVKEIMRFFSSLLKEEITDRTTKSTPNKQVIM